jgi:hypothetical protein
MHSHRLLPVLLLVSLSLCATTTNGLDPIKVDCLSERNYTRGGAFDANLHALLSSLPAAAAASSGFAKNSTGALRNQAFGLAQCRADIAVANVSACRVCLDAALRNVTGSCSSRKAALIIYDDCLLRYSNTNFFGAADTSWWKYICNGHNAQPVVFMQGFTEVMNNLTWMAAYGTPRMFAAGARELTPSVRLYGMAQCTRDLAGDDCMACLSDVANTATVTENCRRKEGGRFYHRSCSVRYEIYPFYHDAQAVEKAMSPAMVRPGDRPTVNGSDPGSTGQSTSPFPSLTSCFYLFSFLREIVSRTPPYNYKSTNSTDI